MGYEINFNRYFYRYKPPRTLAGDPFRHFKIAAEGIG